MLTYQLQARRFVIENDIPFQFPNPTVIELKLGPPTAFGTDSSPSRTVVRAHPATLSFNANTGRWGVQSNPPLQPLGVTLETPSQRLTLRGDLVRFEFNCANAAELEGTILGFKWVFPSLLNLEHADPPIVLYVRGQVGPSIFRWEISPSEWQVEMWPKTRERLESNVIDSFNRLGLFTGPNNRRLAAALAYFHAGSRLSVVGESPWEFMAETILNFAKALEILFATSEATKDDIRRELDRLGYTKDEIEGDFIPILELRRVDIAHPQTAIYKSSDLQVLYRYVHQAEETLRRLLDRVAERISNGSYAIPQTDLSMNAEDRRHMKKLVEVMRARTV